MQNTSGVKSQGRYRGLVQGGRTHNKASYWHELTIEQRYISVAQDTFCQDVLGLGGWRPSKVKEEP